MDTLDRSALEELRSLGSATVYEAAGRGKALAGFIAVDPSLAVAGPAWPVVSPPGDNLAIHRAIAGASKGDVLVVDVGGCTSAGHWGEITTVAAQARGVAGLVINGTVRDSQAILARSFPVFHRGLCILSAKKIAPPGKAPDSLDFDGCTIREGDLVVADADGVAIVDAERVGEVLKAARQRAAEEEETMKRLNAGATTLEIFGWR